MAMNVSMDLENKSGSDAPEGGRSDGQSDTNSRDLSKYIMHNILNVIASTTNNQESIASPYCNVFSLVYNNYYWPNRV